MGESVCRNRAPTAPVLPCPDDAFEVLLLCGEADRAGLEALEPQLYQHGFCGRLLVADDQPSIAAAMTQTDSPCVVAVVVSASRPRSQARAALDAASVCAGPTHRLLVLDLRRYVGPLAQVRELCQAADSLFLTLDLHRVSDASLSASASLGAAASGEVSAVVDAPSPQLRVVEPPVVVEEGLRADVIPSRVRIAVGRVDAAAEFSSMPTQDDLPVLVDDIVGDPPPGRVPPIRLVSASLSVALTGLLTAMSKLVN